MTGKTHLAIGIASSLVILQPKTISECLCAINGGMIGGIISDIDSPGKRKSMDYREDPYGWQIYAFIIIGIIIFSGLDYINGNGAVDYVIKHFGPPTLLGGATFIGLLLYGTHIIHRTFTHSFLAGILFTISLCFFL